MGFDQKITWIASYPRSGNTWVRTLLSAYANAGECSINQIMQTGDKNPEFYEEILETSISNWLPFDQAMIKPAAMMRLLERAQGNVMLKTHDANLALAGVSLIPQHLTHAAIYMVRDPRDVALSLQNHYNTSTLDEAVDRMLDDEYVSRHANQGLYDVQLSWKTHIRSWMQQCPYPVYALRYEDLLQDTEKVFSEIVQFLKLGFDKGLIQESIKSCTFDNLQGQEKAEGFRENVGRQFFFKGQMQRWKTEMPKKLQDKIWKACGEEMKSLGYTRDGIK